MLIERIASTVALNDTQWHRVLVDFDGGQLRLSVDLQNAYRVLTVAEADAFSSARNSIVSLAFNPYNK